MPESSITVREPRGATRSSTGTLLGIWRLMERIHVGRWTELYVAQPADAAGSPRCDYVAKIVPDRGPETTAVQRIEAVQQLKSHVCAVQQVREPHVAPILDYSFEGNIPYLVMPALPGRSLGEWIEIEQWQPLPVAMWWIRQCAQGLTSLHAGGWVHGDLKPENMIVASRGHVTLIDFGFARAIHRPLPTAFQGTVEYAAPELLLAKEQSPQLTQPASDIYSLGVMLWQLTQRQSSPAQSQQAIGELVESDGLLERLICEMTSVDPQDRPTAKQVRDRLLRLEIESLGQHIRPQRRAA